MIAEFHTKAINEMSEARLVGVFDFRKPAADRIAEMAEKGTCQVHDSIEALLANPEIDVVCVCTPSGGHMEPAVATAKAGKHVVVEKPLEITVGRCDAIIKACDDAGVRLCTIFPSRFSPANLTLKAAIETGRFGRLTLGDTYIKWWRTQRRVDESVDPQRRPDRLVDG
jgi:predicted dehydrogenase